MHRREHAVARQLMAIDPLTAHTRDERGILEITTARPVRAALMSAVMFSVGAAMPLRMAAVSSHRRACPDRARRILRRPGRLEQMVPRFACHGRSLIAGLLVCLSATANAADSDQLGSRGKVILQQNCGRCHAVRSHRREPAQASPADARYLRPV